MKVFRSSLLCLFIFLNLLEPNSYAAEDSIHISADRLMINYQKNEIAADLRYKDKILCVTGTIDSIAKDFLGNPFVKCSANSFFSGVQFFFNKKDEPILAQLSKGDCVTIIGKCRGMMFTDVILKECYLNTEKGLPLAGRGGKISALPLLVYSNDKVNIYIPKGMIDAIILNPMREEGIPISDSFFVELFICPKPGESRKMFREMIIDDLKDKGKSEIIGEISYISETIGFDRQKKERIIFNERIIDEKGNVIFDFQRYERLELKGFLAQVAENIASILEREK